MTIISEPEDGYVFICTISDKYQQILLRKTVDTISVQIIKKLNMVYILCYYIIYFHKGFNTI